MVDTVKVSFEALNENNVRFSNERSLVDIQDEDSAIHKLIECKTKIISVNLKLVSSNTIKIAKGQ